MPRLAASGVLLGVALCAPSVVAEQVFTDRATFNAAIPVQVVEDFEDTNVTAGDLIVCDAPASSASNDGTCFNAGDIVAGLLFADSPGPDAGGLGLVGPGAMGYASRALGVSTGADGLVIGFAPAAIAFGANLVTLPVDGDVTVNVYDASLDLLETGVVSATLAGTFWGYHGDVPFAYVAITSPNDAVEVVDDVAFALAVCGDGVRSPYGGESCDDGGTTGGDGCAANCRMEILYDQLGYWDSANHVPSQNFEAALDGYDCEAADDFVVPSGETWDIDTVYIHGEQASGGSVDSVNVSLHVDATGLPGAVATSLAGGACEYAAVVPAETNGELVVTLPSGCVLAAGTYWLRVQANQDHGTDGNWFWRLQTSATGATAAWRNPSDGLGLGCTSWSAVTACAWADQGPDLAFGIDGARQGCGDGEEQTYLDEECDDGTGNSDTVPDACRTSCLDPSCGDGVTDTGEECDDGNTAPGDGCDGSCMDEGTGGTGPGGTGTGGTGTGGTGTGGEAGTGTPVVPGSDATDDGGCGCRAARANGTGWGVLSAWVLLWLAGLACRRRPS